MIKVSKGKGKKRLKRHGKYLHVEICLFGKGHGVISEIFV